MRVLKTIRGLKTALPQDRTIGLVPTMGALHKGHASLIKQAKQDNEIVVVSIFVNPLQFSEGEDLEKYPQKSEQDDQLCQELGVDLVFTPNNTEMGVDSSRQTQVIPAENLTSSLCGAFRTGHFTGVATIVTKLFNIVSPNIAYFGEKDFQQLVIIKQIVEDLNLSVKIKACPTVREESGLALSSRNSYLSIQEKKEATSLYKALKAVKNVFECQKERDAYSLLEVAKKVLKEEPNLSIQYLELVSTQTLTPLQTVEDEGLLAVAAYLGSTRLIDNIKLNARLPIIAIDGPAGAGKSTVTRRLAQKLGLLYLDSGAMYRAITWLIITNNIALDDQVAIAELVSQAEIKLIPTDSLLYSTEVYINQQHVTSEIRSPEVTFKVSTVAAIASVRTVLVQLQKAYGVKGGVIAEGRDIGTDVFPEALLKIFLTASVEERVKRRQKDLQNQGKVNTNLDKLAQDIKERDYLDSHRAISPLRKAPDAIELITDGLSLEQVAETIVNLYQEKIGASY